METGYVVVCCLFLICAYTDLRWRLIYNSVLIPVALVGLLFAAIGGGIREVIYSLIRGVCLAFPLFLMYIQGGVGGGDVKLAMATGLLLPLEMGCQVIFWGGAAAGVYVVVEAVRRGRFREVALGTVFLLFGAGRNRGAFTIPLGFWISAAGILLVGRLLCNAL